MKRKANGVTWNGFVLKRKYRNILKQTLKFDANRIGKRRPKTHKKMPSRNQQKIVLIKDDVPDKKTKCKLNASAEQYSVLRNVPVIEQHRIKIMLSTEQHDER